MNRKAVFISFLPAVSAKATRKIRDEIRGMYVPTGKSESGVGFPDGSWMSREVHVQFCERAGV